MSLFIDSGEADFNGLSATQMRRKIQRFVSQGLVDNELYGDMKGVKSQDRDAINVGSPFAYITDKVIGENVSSNLNLLLGMAKTSAGSYNLNEEEKEEVITGITEATVNISRASQYVSIIGTEIQSGIFEFNEVKFNLMQLAEKSGDYAKHMLAISNSYKEKSIELASQGDEITAKDIETISDKFSDIASTFEGIAASVDIMLDNVALSVQSVINRANQEESKKNEMAGIFKGIAKVINKAMHGDSELKTENANVAEVNKEAVLREVADGIHKGLSKAVKQAGTINNTLEDALLSMSSQLSSVNKDISQMIKDNKHDAVKVNSNNLQKHGVQFQGMKR